MNKNTKRNKAAFLKANKGNWPKPVYKKKAKPFPTPNKDEDMTMTRQRAIFYGV